jgi:hypothetical protein
MKSGLSGFCLLVLFASSRSDAQYAVKSGVSLERKATEPARSLSASRLSSQASFPVLARRTAAGGAGWFLGAVAGGYVGYHVLSHDCGGCDDPGIDAIIQGGFVGGAIGAGLGAAAPILSSKCSFATRFGRSLLGSAAGSAIGLLFRPSSSTLLAVPILSVSGAALAEWSC